MKQLEMETLISAHVAEEVVAVRSQDVWECHVHGRGIPPDMDVRVIGTKNEVRTWASLDTLERWVRDRGWSGRIQVES